MSFYAHQSNESGDFSIRIHHEGEFPRELQIVDGENRTKLIVNYLPQTLRDDELLHIFSKCGQVISAKIIRDASTQYSFGYGFVEFTRPDEAARAIETLKGYPIQNKRLGVAYARVHDREALKNTNLYVANLPNSHLNEASLRDLFAPYGKLINVKLLRDERTRQLRGTAFVRFDRREEAEDAIRNLNGYRLAGSVEGLIVKVSEEHGKQKATVYSSRPHPPPPVMPAHPPPLQFYYPANDYSYDSQQRHRGGGPYRGGRGGGPRVERWSDRPSSSSSYGGGGSGALYERRSRGGGRGRY